MKTVVLLSGGLDSVTALYETKAHHEVVGSISFNYGSKHNQREIAFAEYHARTLSVRPYVVDLNFVGELFESDLLKKGGAIPKGHYEQENMKRTVVPFRNGIMLSIAAGFAESKGAEGIVIAAHAGDHAIYPDCRENFMEAMSHTIQFGTYTGVQLLRPFILMTKAEIVARGQKLGIDYRKTWSCYVGGSMHCGECGTCVERREAFINAGIDDPTLYQRTDALPRKPTAA